MYELFVAVVAAEGLFAGVQSDVGLEVMVSRELLLADAAGERLLAGVGPLVVLEDVFVSEALITRFAGELAAGGDGGGAAAGYGVDGLLHGCIRVSSFLFLSALSLLSPARSPLIWFDLVRSGLVWSVLVWAGHRRLIVALVSLARAPLTPFGQLLRRMEAEA